MTEIETWMFGLLVLLLLGDISRRLGRIAVALETIAKKPESPMPSVGAR